MQDRRSRSHRIGQTRLGCRGGRFGFAVLVSTGFQHAKSERCRQDQYLNGYCELRPNATHLLLCHQVLDKWPLPASKPSSQDTRAYLLNLSARAHWAFKMYVVDVTPLIAPHGACWVSLLNLRHDA